MIRHGAREVRKGGRDKIVARRGRQVRPSLLELEHRMVLSTFLVTNIADSGGGSLRDAIGQANANPGSDMVAFDGTVFNSPQTIHLSSGPLKLTDAATTTVSGPGANLLSISGDKKSRVFYSYYGSAELSGLTITGGSAGAGAGLFNYGGTTTLSNCTVSGNSANFSGGGVSTYYGTTTLTNCTVSGNSAQFGGGVYNYGGTTNLTNCSVSGNSARTSAAGWPILTEGPR